MAAKIAIRGYSGDPAHQAPSRNASDAQTRSIASTQPNGFRRSSRMAARTWIASTVR